MRNEFRENLALVALKNKKLLRLQKKLFLLPFLEFRETFLQFSRFRNQIFLHKILSRNYYDFLILVK